MDEAFSIFIEQVGEPTSRQEVPPSSVEHYRGQLPDKLLEYWIEHGWCGYGDGLFWTVNPQEYEGVVTALLESADLKTYDVFHAVARGAFGDLYLFGEKSGFSLKFSTHVGRYTGSKYSLAQDEMGLAVENFFMCRDLESNDFDDMFDLAIKRLGKLAPDEMYGFVPALVFGGAVRSENLEKLKVVEHLVLLAQMCKMEPYSFSDF
ncbi:GAD-like domain-containing protein [Pseudomonas sp. PSKL.D1]|uniref:GAD-like domain-containing protein n=1 Tax=Pseudomonas sp. PSKL.D1 TaxID=3029060 RepID=UPI002380EB1D|nr:GAD-like domain-containing protein [Pseudomonas sp. PSKL.D1]WDY57245.1 GAD-like domain-containing protein [Pseudomonas sp. PSKL.D1]